VGVEDERVFEAREMLAEVVIGEHPEMAAALLEGVLDDGRFFVVSSTLEALEGDGAGAEAVALAERRLIDVARAAPTDILVEAACEIAEGLSPAAREELAEQWRLAGELSWDGPDALRPAEEGVCFPADDVNLRTQVHGATGVRRGAAGTRRRGVGGSRGRIEGLPANACSRGVVGGRASRGASVATPANRPGRHAPGRAPPWHSADPGRNRVGTPPRREHRRSRRSPRRAELTPALARRRAAPRGSAPGRRGSRA
jgi:hypothetical protein